MACPQAVRLVQLGLAVVCLTLAAGPSQAQPLLVDEFLSLDQTRWSTCQIDMLRAPPVMIDDPGEPGDEILRIAVDGRMVSDNCCNDALCRLDGRGPEMVARSGMRLVLADVPGAGLQPEDDLGPSLLGLLEGPEAESATLAPSTSGYRVGDDAVEHTNPYCTEAVQQLAAQDIRPDRICIQRQELRPAKTYWHAYDEPYRYSIRFRMPGDVDDAHVMRWVTAQWKHEPISSSYDDAWGPEGGPSPFLAQRYDGGVFYITVQDEHCRCIVASEHTAHGAWDDGAPSLCRWTAGPQEGTACQANLTVTYGDDPDLTSPRDQWVEMSYTIRAGRDGAGFIEIREGDRFIARVEGDIGYRVDPGQQSLVKFKFGHYRDYQPGTAFMDVDRVEISRADP